MSYFVWLLFFVIVGAMVALDLGVFHRKARVVAVREALGWTLLWIAVALVFNVFVYFLYEGNWLDWETHAATGLSGREAAVQFLAGYVVEKSLSIDNIFVIAMIFAYFAVPLREQHRVLFWGIFGAVILRGIMIGLGTVLISRFEWVIYVFGALLIWSAVRMFLVRNESFDVDRNPVVRLAQKVFPLSNEYSGSRFFVRINGRVALTPLALALILVETSDVMFAVDSIPAVLAITRDPFLVFTSNVFAILGLRSLYFVLAGMMEKFRYLKLSLVFLLGYVGTKMLLSHHHPIPNTVSLAVIGGILAVGLLASVVANRRAPTPAEPNGQQLRV